MIIISDETILDVMKSLNIPDSEYKQFETYLEYELLETDRLWDCMIEYREWSKNFKKE